MTIFNLFYWWKNRNTVVKLTKKGEKMCRRIRKSQKVESRADNIIKFSEEIHKNEKMKSRADLVKDSILKFSEEIHKNERTNG